MDPQRASLRVDVQMKEVLIMTSDKATKNHWFDHLVSVSDAERIVRRVRRPILVVHQENAEVSYPNKKAFNLFVA
jgi:hypothetical protein